LERATNPARRRFAGGQPGFGEDLEQPWDPDGFLPGAPGTDLFEVGSGGEMGKVRQEGFRRVTHL